MSGRDEELLSAYFDGELSVDERASVEQWLADDLAAREALDDVAEVSGWVSSLPRGPAPPGLKDGVLARVRAMRPSATVRPTLRPTRRRAGWIVAAAGVLLAVGALAIWQRTDDDRLIAKHVTTEGRRLDGNADFGASSTPLAPGESLAATRELQWADFDADSVEFTRVAAANATALQQDLALALNQGQAPVPGETLAQLDQVGEQVVIFEYRVVDTQDMFSQVQVLLTQNGFVPVEEPLQSEALVDAAQPTAGMRAIYLDAPSTNYNSAVTAIQNLDAVTAVSTNTVTFGDSSPRADHKSLGVEYARESEVVEARTGLSAAAAESPAPPSLSKDGADAPAAPDSAQPVPPASAPEPAAANTAAARPEERFNAPGDDSLPAATALAESDRAYQASDAYQLVVTPDPELLQELEANQDVFLEKKYAAERAPVVEPEQKIVRNQAWPSLARRAGPPSAGRVRAVILLVPAKADDAARDPDP